MMRKYKSKTKGKKLMWQDHNKTNQMKQQSTINTWGVNVISLVNEIEYFLHQLQTKRGKHIHRRTGYSLTHEERQVSCLFDLSHPLSYSVFSWIRSWLHERPQIFITDRITRVLSSQCQVSTYECGGCKQKKTSWRRVPTKRRWAEPIPRFAGRCIRFHRNGVP